MFTKIKMALLRKLRDLHFYGARVCDKAALNAAINMAKAQKAGKSKTVNVYWKMYVIYTRGAMCNRSIVGRYSARIIRNKSA